MIAATPNPERLKKYKFANNVLLGLLIITIISKILIGLSLFSQISIALTPFAIFLPIINILFAFEVARFKGYIYNILGVLTIAGILQMLGEISNNGTYGIIDIIIGLLIAGLAFYIGNKMFPNYGLYGPKKDANGELRLE